MKSITQLIICSYFLFVTISSSRLFFEKGEVCHKSIRNFNPDKKTCPEGTKCLHRGSPMAETTGLPKYCLEPPAKYRHASEASLFFEKEELCHKSTPNFNSEKKTCPEGTVCRYKKIPERGMTGVSKFCLEPLAKYRHASEASLFFEKGDVCHKSTPNFNSEKKTCPEGTVCKYKTTDRETTGLKKYCM